MSYYCKSRIFRMHVIFVYFVRGGFRTKIKACKRYKQVRESAAVSDCTKISCVRKVGEPRIRKMSAYEIFWIYSISCNSFPNVIHWRCPETLFISHENANFLFSVFRVVQDEAKTPKIMGCCRANFAFLPALKMGTFSGKWTWEWVVKTSLFVHLAL